MQERNRASLIGLGVCCGGPFLVALLVAAGPAVLAAAADILSWLGGAGLFAMLVYGWLRWRRPIPVAPPDSLSKSSQEERS